MPSRKILHLFTFLVLLFGFPIGALAQYQIYSDQNYPSINYAEGRTFDRYVDAQNGSDANDGKSWTTAWKTLNHGISEMVDNGNGRWLHIRGKFTPPAPISLYHRPDRGTAADPMVIVADPVEGATIDATNFDLDLSSQHHWLIDGRNRLVVTNAQSFIMVAGWEDGNTSNITVRNLTGYVTRPSTNGSNVGFIYSDGINYVGAFNNRIIGPSWNFLGAGIYITKAPQTRIENNFVTKFSRPIFLKHDQYSSVTQAETSIVIKNNFVPYDSSSAGTGAEVNVASRWALIENNIFGIPLDIGVEGGNNSPDGGSYNKIYHNTLNLLKYTVADTIPQYNTAQFNIIIPNGKEVFKYHPDLVSKNISDYNIEQGPVTYGNTTLSVADFGAMVGQDAHSLQRSVSFEGGSNFDNITTPSGYKVVGGNSVGQYDFGDGVHTAGADVTIVGQFPVTNINPPSAIQNFQVK